MSAPAARLALTGLALLSTMPLLARGEWFLHATAGGSYDDNLPRAERDADIESDYAFEAAVTGGRLFPLTERTSLSLGATLGGVRHVDFGGMDHGTVDLSAALHGKLGLGLAAPWWRIGAGAAILDFDFDPRDGWRYHAQAAMGRRFGERTSVAVSYAFERRRADDVVDIPFLVTTFGLRGDAFDGDTHTLAINGSHDLTERLALVLGYARRTGDVTATTRIGPGIFAASDAIAADPVFGVDRFAYRVDADTDVFQAGLSLALGDHAALDAGYERRDSDADGFGYVNNIARVSLRYSY